MSRSLPSCEAVKYFLGIDVGTFEAKAVLVDQYGAVAAQATRSHNLIVPRPGWAEHRPREDWWDNVVALSRELLRTGRIDPATIAAIATSAIGPCVLPLDANGEPLTNGILYGIDTRASAEIELLIETIGKPTLTMRTGNILTSQSAGPKILWLKNHRPDLYKQARMFLSAAPYITYRLTGRYVMDHFTAASFTPLYDISSQAWSLDLAPQIVPDVSYLPGLLWSNEIAGPLTKEAAAAMGLRAGTPVLCGTIDAAAEALSVGVRNPADMMIMYGSSTFMIQVTEQPVCDHRLWYAPWLFNGLHTSQAGLSTSGTLTRWIGEQLFSEVSPSSVMQAMMEEGASSPPGAKGLLLLPHFSGERTPIHNPSARGMIFGLDLTHCRADIYRAAIEGIGYSVRRIIETYQEAGISPGRLLAVGGGTRNPLWLGAVSDICKLVQQVRRVSLGASYGNAFLAALATGHAQADDIEKWNANHLIRPPDRATFQIYDRQYDIFRALYDRTADLMAELAMQRGADEPAETPSDRVRALHEGAGR